MNGFLCVLKPPGMTSSDVVVRVRGKLKRAGLKVKVGHAGTLDPEASGVLPLMIGKASRLFDYLVERKKHMLHSLNRDMRPIRRMRMGRSLAEAASVLRERSWKAFCPSS